MDPAIAALNTSSVEKASLDLPGPLLHLALIFPFLVLLAFPFVFPPFLFHILSLISALHSSVSSYHLDLLA